MPSITVVTTFHPAGYTLYGKRFLESFAKRVDKRIKLLVYAEGVKPENPDPTRITILDQVEALPKLITFKNRWKDDPRANGIPPDEIKEDDLETGTKHLNGTLCGLLIKFMLCSMHVKDLKTGVYGWMQIHLYTVIGVMNSLLSFFQ